MTKTHDSEWAKLSELKAGQEVRLDGLFTCVVKGVHIIESDSDGLFFRCDHGRHYLIGQVDDGIHCVGVYR